MHGVWWIITVEKQTQWHFCCCFRFVITSNFGFLMHSFTRISCWGSSWFMIFMCSRQEIPVLKKKKPHHSESFFFFFWPVQDTIPTEKPRIASGDHLWSPFGFHDWFSDRWYLLWCRCHHEHYTSFLNKPNLMIVYLCTR